MRIVIDIGFAIMTILLAVAVIADARDNGWRAALTRHGAMLVRALSWFAVSMAASVLLPFWVGLVACAAIGFAWGRLGPLGVLNFLVLQWCGVRLVSVQQRVLMGDDPSCFRHVRWTLLRWVWPLTGWWSAYRWIVRRP